MTQLRVESALEHFDPHTLKDKVAVKRIAVMGTGSWGTTVAQVMADAGGDVRMWGRSGEACHDINEQHRNLKYLPQIELPHSITASTDPAEVLHKAEIVVIAVPSQSARDLLEQWRPLLSEGAILVSLMKGIELGTSMRMSEVMASATQWPMERIAVISGPNLAAEVAARKPSATVVAATDEAVREEVAQACQTKYMRPYTNEDVIGVEIGGAAKNVIALAVGVAEGMQLGDNAKAAILTRGLAEVIRLALAMGAKPTTLAGLAGMGDLVATCASPLSRNRTFGEHLGRGLPLKEVVALTKQTAEAVKSCGPLVDLATRYGVELPLAENVLAMVRDGMEVDEMYARILSRPRTDE